LIVKKNSADQAFPTESDLFGEAASHIPSSLSFSSQNAPVNNIFNKFFMALLENIRALRDGFPAICFKPLYKSSRSISNVRYGLGTSYQLQRLKEQTALCVMGSWRQNLEVF